MNAFCNATGVGLIPWAPLCRGHLARPPSAYGSTVRSEGEKKNPTFTTGQSESDQEVIKRVQELREEFWQSVNVPGTHTDLNQALERAGRVADFMEFGELLARDALARNESCGGHFREEYQTKDNDTLRDDVKFCHVAAWEHGVGGRDPVRHVEPLDFKEVPLTQRSYK